MNIFFILLETIIISSLLYSFLYLKTKINIKFLHIDNIGVIIIISITGIIFNIITIIPLWFIILVCQPLLITLLAFIFTMWRFWRTPNRKMVAKDNEIVSPADGNVIYIKKIKAGEMPVSVKGKRISKLEEITKTNLLTGDCWLIGINMTLFDVHKNCSPVNGEIILQHYVTGRFFSLKSPESETENERNTFIIQTGNYKVGVVQIASRLVRKIDSYIGKGDFVKKGDWIGMIRFGSQVDVIIPHNCKVLVNVTNQVYAKKTIIAEF